MQTASRSIVYNTHSAANTPQITVKPGEVFVAETELCSGGWLKTIDDIFSPEKSSGTNPCVCIAVEGARPGDMLAVEILDIVPDSLGYTGFTSGAGWLPNKIMPEGIGSCAKTVRIEDGLIWWSDKLKLPIKPMIGVLGTAPDTEALYNSRGGPHGGNMDVQEVCAGATVYLPVAVDGALLHVGDVHAIQGDGEINGAGGVECRAAVKLRVSIAKRLEHFGCVRIENADYIMTFACGRAAEDAFHSATEQLVRWMASDYGYTTRDAYLLLGQVMEARCTQYVNPTSSYVCKMPKKYLM